MRASRSRRLPSCSRMRRRESGPTPRSMPRPIRPSAGGSSASASPASSARSRPSSARSVDSRPWWTRPVAVGTEPPRGSTSLDRANGEESRPPAREPRRRDRVAGAHRAPLARWRAGTGGAGARGRAVIVGGRIRFAAAGRALHHRNFRLFFFGQLISVTGTWMQSLALGWLLGTLVGWNQAVVYIGLLGVVQFLPVLVLGLFGGIIADVWPKRMTVVGTQTAAGLLALSLGGLDYLHVIAVWHVFVLAFLLGLVNAVDMPSRQSFVVEMVGRDDVANAIALNSAVFNSARIVGPAIAGVLIGLLGTALCFILNGLSYGAVVVGLLAMHDSELRPAPRLEMPRKLTAVRSDLGEGVSYVRTTPLVLLVLAVIGFVSTFGMNFNVLLPVVAATVLNVGPNGFGYLYASMGAGALVSAVSVCLLYTSPSPRDRTR